MASGYLETSMVVGPFSNRSMRALVSGSNVAWARAAPAAISVSAAAARSAACDLRWIVMGVVFFMGLIFHLEAVGKLKNKRIGRQGVGAVTAQPFVVALEEQGVGEVIDVAGRI